MNQQPDKLFHEKLTGLSRPVSASAWSRVEANLDKKNNKALWLKIAATLLVLAVASFILWKANAPTQSLVSKKQTIQPNKEEKKQPDQQKVQPSQENTIDQNKRAEERIDNVPLETKAIKKKSKPKVDVSSPVTPIISKEQELSSQRSLTIAENTIDVTPAENLHETIVESTPQSSIAEVSTEKEEGVTLIYTIDEVNEKYLDKKSLAEATSPDKKPSTLRKLLDKAYDLKHNQDPFGDLREKKNEILALNFKSDKQRSQNK